MLKRVSNRIKNDVWKKEHEKLNQINRKRFHNQDVSIISMNCTGGILSHDLGIQFRSPTVNMFMRAEAFVKFCENLEHYLSVERFVECNDPQIIEDRTYPVVWLDDILLFLVHYHSVEEAQLKWDERKARVNWDNIVIINTDREGMTEVLKDRFEKLPYPKVMFTHLPDEIHPSCYYLTGWEKEKCVGIITDHDTWDGKRPVDQFDWVEFLNGVDR
ncbi:MAG: DUF1919 domain-containing protein [Eubacterium sp.]|nr:DUF1919 domain-containing protein [Eubacterium sp.]